MPNDTYLALYNAFVSPPEVFSPYVYFSAMPAGDEDDYRDQMRRLADCGVGGIIPLVMSEAWLFADAEEAGLPRFAALHDRFACILRAAVGVGLGAAFVFEPEYERIYLALHDDYNDQSACAKELLPIEHVCLPGEAVELLLRADPLMSLVALDESCGEVIDLRDCVDGRTLHWTVPDGNWKIIQYVCADCADCGRVNPLSYDAVFDYLQQTYAGFADLFRPLPGGVPVAIAYRDFAFTAPNHRNWDPEFNRVFAETYGFDPVLLYPALFTDIGAETERAKAMLLDCRAKMMSDGMLRAYADFAESLGVQLSGRVAEPKLTASAAVVGDAYLAGRYAPGALLEKAYMYGVNSIRIASGAAYGYDRAAVSCEMYRGYPQYAPELLLNEAATAFAQGVNRMLTHPDAFGSGADAEARKREYFAFLARAQALLRGGRHVSDIAVLYPSASLQSGVYFYQADVRGFEYPSVPSGADYMTLLNSISIYAGHDPTLLHPEVLAERCTVADGELRLHNAVNAEIFRVVVLPSTPIIRLDNLRLLRDFFAGGGKIIATGELPRMALTPAPGADAEVRALIGEIFGEDALDGNVMRAYDYHANANGGEAYHLYNDRTAIDGTEMTSGALIDETIKSLGLPYDILMPGMIRLTDTGALGLPYPDFSRLGLDRMIPGYGMLSHIHKVRDGCDIYYFANATDRDYCSPILLRGAHQPERWDPMTGECEPMAVSYVTYKDTLYTKTRLELPAGSSVFYVSASVPTPRRAQGLDSLDTLD